jgi:vesicular inhibitory amino acid transporter
MSFPSILLSDTGTADQISQNLLQVPEYNPMLNKLVLWMLVVTPLYGHGLILHGSSKVV